MKKFWDFISNLGYTPELPHEEARRIKLLSRLNAISFLNLLLYLVIDLFIQVHTFIPLIGTTMLFLIINLFLLYKRIYTLAKHSSGLTIAFCISFLTLATGDTFSEAFFIPLTAMPLIIFKERKIALMYLFSILALIVILKLEQSSFTPLIKVNAQQRILFTILNITCSALIAWFLVFYFKAANEEYEAKLIKMHLMVTEKNKEITDSIRYAKRIQDSLITSEKYMAKALSRLMMKNKFPADNAD